MGEHDNLRHRPAPPGSFWMSRTGIVMMVFVASAALLLGYEHRLHLLGGNGLLLVLLGLCVGMHLLMHRGHGGHGGTRPDDGNRP